MVRVRCSGVCLHEMQGLPGADEDQNTRLHVRLRDKHYSVLIIRQSMVQVSIKGDRASSNTEQAGYLSCGSLSLFEGLSLLMSAPIVTYKRACSPRRYSFRCFGLLREGTAAL